MFDEWCCFDRLCGISLKLSFLVIDCRDDVIGFLVVILMSYNIRGNMLRMLKLVGEHVLFWIILGTVG